MKNNYQLKIKRQLLTVCLLMLPLTFSLFAQTSSPLEVQGQITDGTSPIPGATVLIKGEQRGAVSDFNGHFKITAQPTDTLVISYIGYAIVEEPVNNRTTINITMQDDATTLREVVINAGYYSVKDRERTGSISRITATEIQRQPITNPLEAIQGRMAGVQITQNTGAPGGSFNISIRGLNSLRSEGNEPLYIIDGVPYLSQSMGDRSVSTVLGSNPTSPLNSLNPGDIQSIEILKDADATAIYGSRGANGVVLITTKKAKPGNTTFNISTVSGFGRVTRTTKLLNTPQYLTMRAQAFENDGFTELPETAYDVNGTWDQNRYTDWQKELIGGTAYKNTTSASITGGTNHTRFLISTSHHNETTVFPGNSKYRRTSALANINHSSENERFIINFSAGYHSDNNDLPATDFTNEARLLSPNAPALKDENGHINWENNTFNNPLRLLNAVYLSKASNLVSNISLSYEIIPDLTLSTALGYNDYKLDESRTNPSSLFNPAFGVPSSFSSILVNDGASKSWIVEPQLNWKKQIGKSELTLLMGTTFQKMESTGLRLTAQGFSSNSLIYNLAAASTIEIRENNINVYKYNAVYGRINYKYDNKYILNLTARRDGSSRFGPGNRFANFGALGAAWIFSEEATIKNNWGFLSFGKLRGSYGTTGNDQIGDYRFLDSFSIGEGNYNNVVGLYPTQLFNPNFAWETNEKFEAAVELGFWNDRLYLTGAYYNNTSSNQLTGIPMPGTTGFNSLQANFDAVVQNTGFEFEARAVPIQEANFRWVSSFNFTLPKNKLRSFEGLENSTYANTLEIGKPLTIVKLYQFNGVNPETGIYEFEDFNDDGQINAIDDAKVLVDLGVKYYGGWQNNLNYKNWNLDFLFQFVNKKGWNNLSIYPLPGTNLNQPVMVLDNWQQPGDNASIQAFTTGADPFKAIAHARHRSSDAAVSDASFIRLKNIELAYNLPTSVTKGFNVRLFLRGQNLLTLTKYEGPDPENLTFNRLPPLKIVATGFHLTF